MYISNFISTFFNASDYNWEQLKIKCLDIKNILVFLHETYFIILLSMI